MTACTCGPSKEQKRGTAVTSTKTIAKLNLQPGSTLSAWAKRLGAGAMLFALASGTAHAESTLRIVMQAGELKGIDPVFTTATFARDHGFLVYDQLFSLDSNGKPQPQMVDSYEIAADSRTYRFTLRSGLTFSDGSPVRAQDAVASILRWKDRDIVGRALFAAGAKVEAIDDKTFTLALSEPFGLVLEALAKSTAGALFVMPEAVARTPATEQITSAVGSGPFVFQQSEWQAGSKAVYLRNPAYQPRPEPADGLAGGKVAKVDRIEWLALPDANTALSALIAGEIDYLQQPPMETYPLIESDDNLKLTYVDPNGSMLWVRMNHLQAPFDNPKGRQALLHIVDQVANMQAIGAPAGNYLEFCGSYFMCGTPLETSAGTEGMATPDLDKARALLAEAGYDGREIVFMHSGDQSPASTASLVVADRMRQAGLNVKVEALDWGTLSQRRNSKEPPEDGGWNVFITTASTLDASTPLTNVYLASPCPNNIAGFSCDEELEKLRQAWWQSGDEQERKDLVDRIQLRAYDVVPYVNGGQWRQYAAIRSNIKGIGATIIPVFWGVEKSE